MCEFSNNQEAVCANLREIFPEGPVSIKGPIASVETMYAERAVPRFLANASNLAKFLDDQSLYNFALTCRHIYSWMEPILAVRKAQHENSNDVIFAPFFIFILSFF